MVPLSPALASSTIIAGVGAAYAAANFGCGSLREAAVYVLYDFGIRCVIASLFGDIHYGNELQNGVLPVI